MTLVKAIKAIHSGEEQIVTPLVEQWFHHHPDGIRWTKKNKQRLSDLIDRASGNTSETRANRFGASGRGTCKRRQVFQFLGMPGESVIGVQLANIFDDGKWRHLRWQMILLDCGAMTHAEWPVEHERYRVKTSLDALHSGDKIGFELKGKSFYTNGRRMLAVPDRHLLQIHTMMLVTGYKKWSYVVEDKQTQKWQEIVVDRDGVVMGRVKRELHELNKAVDNKILPKPLPSVKDGTGECAECPFFRWCSSQRSWPEGQEWGNG